MEYERGIAGAVKHHKQNEGKLCAANPNSNDVCSLKRGFADPAPPGATLPASALPEVGYARRQPCPGHPTMGNLCP